MKAGVLNVITIVLVFLKLFKVLAISWWLVLTPTFIWLGLALIGLIIVVAIADKANDIINTVSKSLDDEL
ncbi:hypothetical protein [Leuconostoc mesenteroides]|uniref:hypothetical protein n=1 Tax=Leuconostoc mesenteroides TaxID=1245 RepID=UPI0020742F20|nr:hypothetical protein [Leuconostoc mesenteroides]MCM6836090.1 hypothetical protein [Leuconostoc mesenteroides]